MRKFMILGLVIDSVVLFLVMWIGVITSRWLGSEIGCSLVCIGTWLAFKYDVWIKRKVIKALRWGLEI